MQAALQRHVDSSISKTINCPPDIGFEAFKDVYLEAYDLGLKGCTTYRPNAVTGAVLSRTAAAPGTGASLAGPDPAHEPGFAAVSQPGQDTRAARGAPRASRAGRRNRLHGPAAAARTGA